MRVRHLVALVALSVGCSSSKGSMPAPACRTFADCSASGMAGAQCVAGRCTFVGTVMGTIQYPNGTPPPGSLHVVAYPANAFTNSIGPFSGVNPVNTPVVIASPTFPQSYKLSGLPDGSLALYAFIDSNQTSGTDARACTGDIMGVTPATILAGSATGSVDVVVQFPVNTTAFCQ